MTNRDADADLNRWFGMHVRAELGAHGWSSRELARRSGVSASTFTRTGNGEAVTLPVAARIAGALGRPLSDLLVPVTCEQCVNRPPAGFTCNVCGTGTPEAAS